MNCDLVLLARTDALSATFLDSNIDPVDQPFILGCVDPKDPKKLMTFPEAGR
jgi:isocitrate lyase